MSLWTRQSSFWQVLEQYLMDLQPPQSCVLYFSHMAQSGCSYGSVIVVSDGVCKLGVEGERSAKAAGVGEKVV